MIKEEDLVKRLIPLKHDNNSICLADFPEGIDTLLYQCVETRAFLEMPEHALNCVFPKIILENMLLGLNINLGKLLDIRREPNSLKNILSKTGIEEKLYKNISIGEKTFIKEALSRQNRSFYDIQKFWQKRSKIYAHNEENSQVKLSLDEIDKILRFTIRVWYLININVISSYPVLNPFPEWQYTRNRIILYEQIPELKDLAVYYDNYMLKIVPALCRSPLDENIKYDHRPIFTLTAKFF